VLRKDIKTVGMKQAVRKKMDRTIKKPGEISAFSFAWNGE